ncbi:amidohydrolase family protein [Sphaerisporangium fuscum]|uniref:amidohydrolase family protein n=1 Tax=Sphaerisporangium fuscum TaxID=2835868 RepID=UPI001BDD0316|nr:amidohydrolase family protein [Sphaerisporangium fuscum]
MEEAFAIPQLQAGYPVPRTATAAHWVEHWAARLCDYTRHRLPDMDEHGIDIQVLSLTAPGVQCLTDARQAITDARVANDHLADVIAAHPARFRGLAALPLQDPEAAVAELHRAVGSLGLSGALVNDHTAGSYLDDPRYEPVWAALEDLDVPLYLHPGAPPTETWRVLAGRPELQGPLWSWAAETGGHALRLIFGGVFDRHPRATVILGHLGEFLPFQLARLDSRYARQAHQPLARKPSEYFGGNILITTSGVCSPAALAGAVLAIGADAIMFAVDYPFEDTAEAVRFLEQAPISDTDRAKIGHSNAERVLHLHSRPDPPRM